ncbi:MAG: hypothetical protein ACW99A_18275 [Candidatus Kariarchaeaceae archaeon]|jgi:hypothetical protein
MSEILGLPAYLFIAIVVLAIVLIFLFDIIFDVGIGRFFCRFLGLAIYSLAPGSISSGLTQGGITASCDLVPF